MLQSISHSLVAFSLTLAIAVPASATTPSLRSPDAESASLRQAMQTLRRARTFEGVHVGLAGEPSAGVTAFRAIFAADDATERFVTLAETGGTVARLYAAIGLRHHDRDRYRQVMRSLRLVEHTTVETRFGCLGGPTRIGDLLEHRGQDAVRLEDDESIDDWFIEHQTGSIDIFGGGFTSQFAKPLAHPTMP